MFRSMTIIRELKLEPSLSHIYKIDINNTSLRSMWWCGSMLYQGHGGVCAVCCAETDCTAHSTQTLSAQHTAHKSPWT